ncbi:MAG: PIG-L family deacetylase [Anaerolineales bacterium]
MRWIYLSPHLDDAALSAGGWIYDQTRAGASVEIWTLLAGTPRGALSPLAEMLHAQWGIADPSELICARRSEDERAAQILGATPVYFDFLDCIYRTGKDGAWLYGDIFVPPHADEDGLPAQIAEAIAARLRPDDRVLCQLGIGAHIDHTLIRRAAEALRRPLWYTADIPYLFRAPEALAALSGSLAETLQPISAEGVAAWQRAAAAYDSQLDSLFKDEEDMRVSISRYAEEIGGLRLWLSP